MKYIKLFENFSNDDSSRKEWKKKVLEVSNALDILYDLKDISLELLDVRANKEADDEFEDDKQLEKRVVYLVDLHQKDIEYKGNLFGGEFSHESPVIEDSIYWSSDIDEPIEEIEEGFRTGDLYLNITFCVVVGEDGNVTAINDDTSKLYGRISEIYPDVEFDTFNPWDLN
jgi:hypothetical protein